MRVGHDVAIRADDETRTLTAARLRRAATPLRHLLLRNAETTEEIVERILIATAAKALGARIAAALDHLHVDHRRAHGRDQSAEIRQTSYQRRRRRCCRRGAGGWRRGLRRSHGTGGMLRTGCEQRQERNRADYSGIQFLTQHICHHSKISSTCVAWCHPAPVSIPETARRQGWPAGPALLHPEPANRQSVRTG